jgi:colanic acid biosynthesis glycosyl transferase WcaI
MRIALMTAHFYPEPAAGQRVHELCQTFAAAGFHTVVFTATPDATLAAEHSEEMTRIEVRRLWSPIRSGIGLLRKTMAMLFFHGAAAIGVLTSGRKFDVIVSVSTPPLAHVTGACLSTLCRSKHVFWCADLHPESAIRLGLVGRNSLRARLMSYLNTWGLRKSDVIVAVGSCMRDELVAAGAPAERTFVVPMWHRDDLSARDTASEVSDLRSRLGLSGHFVAMYSGNLGRMHQFETVLDAATRLTGEITFFVAGSGPGARVLRDFEALAGLPNLRCHPLFPEEELGVSLALPDVHLITLRPEMCGVSVPGKLYGAMASGRPIIFIGPEGSEVARTIREEQCGFVIAPGDTEGLVSALRSLKGDPELARGLGRRGRDAFQDRYCMSKRTSQWVRVIESVVDVELSASLAAAESD